MQRDNKKNAGNVVPRRLCLGLEGEISKMSRAHEDSTSVSSSSVSTRGGGLPRGKKTWTQELDLELVNALTDLCRGGYWKVENGFRSGYLTQLKKLMEEAIPGCGIKANPHIESRLKILRRQTLAISDMINNASGFTWSDQTKMVNAESQVFDDWCMTHVECKGLKGKAFPHYDALAEAFGKERATGKTSGDAHNALHELRPQSEHHHVVPPPMPEVSGPSFFATFRNIVGGNGQARGASGLDPSFSQYVPSSTQYAPSFSEYISSQYDGLDSMDAEDDDTSSQAATNYAPSSTNGPTIPSPVVGNSDPVNASLPSSASPNTSFGGRKKRKARFGDIAEIASSFTKFVELTAEQAASNEAHLKVIERCLLTDTSHHDNRKKAMTEIREITGLTEDEIEDACEIIKPFQVEVFLDTTEHRRAIYIRKILGRSSRD